MLVNGAMQITNIDYFSDVFVIFLSWWMFLPTHYPSIFGRAQLHKSSSFFIICCRGQIEKTSLGFIICLIFRLIQELVGFFFVDFYDFIRYTIFGTVFNEFNLVNKDEDIGHPIEYIIGNDAIITKMYGKYFQNL